MNKIRKILYLLILLVLFTSLTSCEFELNINSNDDETNNNDNENTNNDNENTNNDNDYNDNSLIKTCTHDFINNECKLCNTEKNDYVFSLFGNNTIIYDNDDNNPYNIDLDIYGSDIKAIFYEPVLENDPYISLDKTSFYSTYTPATQYNDAYYRTKNKLISGDITKQGHIPNSIEKKENNNYIKCSTATYVLDINGNYIAYIPNDFQGNNNIIFYGCAYTSLNDVCAYLLAFGELPANSKYDKNNGKTQSILDWGIYGRVNMDGFSGDTSKYPYEPKLPKIGTINYAETDFGTIGGYKNENSITGTSYTQKEYNNGKSISRGAARFVFVNDSRIKSIDDRYVFYTYNHYNDFQEYLNYNNGFGKRFGNESAGNEYCGNKSDYYESAISEPTQYPTVIYKSASEMN